MDTVALLMLPAGPFAVLMPMLAPVISWPSRNHFAGWQPSVEQLNMDSSSPTPNNVPPPKAPWYPTRASLTMFGPKSIASTPAT